jgi:DNA-binding CsgD family transcriptional regulator
MTELDALGLGRDAFRRQAWSDAYTHLSAADRRLPLDPDDLERLAVTARMVGKDAECADLWARAHRESLRAGQIERAVRYAFWLAFGLLNSGEMARGSGWLARAQKLLDDGQLDCVEKGYLLMPVAIATMEEDPTQSYEMFEAVIQFGTRFKDASLAALGRMGLGRSLIRLGRGPEGLPLLDDAIVAVSANEVHPMVVGDLYCAAIEACWEIFDLRRAREWTTVLTDWCASQPDLVPYRGQCLIHRTQILQLNGAWSAAMDEVQRACQLLSDPPGQPVVALALYQRAELHRLLGEFAKAEESYRLASESGRSPHPGLAQLRLVQGRADAAEAAIRRVVEEALDRITRSQLLPAYVEIMLVARDVIAARAAADELSMIAETFDAPLLRAFASSATGAVFLAEGDARAALATLRTASAAWQELEAPFEAACVRELIGAAYRDLGDEDGAELELDAARHVFEQLGAAPHVARLEQLSGRRARGTASGLTGRELEVLRLIAAGNSNRGIAEKLVLSEKTVARHISNIFVKLGLSSRSAATAYAYEHNLV